MPQGAEAFIRSQGYKVGKSDPADDLIFRYWMGRAHGSLWAVATDPGPPEGVIVRCNLKGEIQAKHPIPFSVLLQGTIDGDGALWSGDTDAHQLYRMEPDGTVTHTIPLTDGADPHIPLGMLWLPASGGFAPALFVIGQNASTQTLRAFRLDNGARVVSAFGAALGAATVIQSLGATLVVEPTAQQIYYADPDFANRVGKFHRGTLTLSSVAFAARNRGVWGIHHAFGKIWVGANPLVVNTGPAQITSFEPTTGTIHTTALLTNVEVSAFADDGEFLYAAVSGNIAGAGNSPNHVAKIDPDSGAVVDKFFYSGAATPFTDGFGDRILDLISVSEPEKLPRPEMADAALWFRGDDPESLFLRVAGVLRHQRIPNRGPRRELLAHEVIASRFGGPAPTLLNGLRGMDYTTGSTFLETTTTPLTQWRFFHNAESFTLLFVIRPTDADAAQIVLDTMGTLDNANTGVRLLYDGTDESLRFVIGNSSGANFVIDVSTTTGSVPLNETTIVSISYDPLAPVTELFLMRLVPEPPSEPRVEVTDEGVGETPDAGDSGTSLEFGTNGGTFRGQLPEVIAILGPRRTERELRSLEKYLSRWQP